MILIVEYIRLKIIEIYGGIMKHLLSPLDLSVEELNNLLDLARDISHNPDKYSKRCEGKKLATLFENEEVLSIHSSEPTLETVFIELTGKELV